jgi:hypothetical protein
VGLDHSNLIKRSTRAYSRALYLAIF